MKDVDKGSPPPQIYFEVYLISKCYKELIVNIFI